MSDDLVTWLRAQLDDDERAARAWLPLGNPTAADREHAARHDPARVLAEVDAKRLILAEHPMAEYRDECRRCFDPDTAAGDYDFETFPCPTLRALALPYADRPGYRDEWKP